MGEIFFDVFTLVPTDLIDVRLILLSFIKLNEMKKKCQCSSSGFYSLDLENYMFYNQKCMFLFHIVSCCTVFLARKM